MKSSTASCATFHELQYARSANVASNTNGLSKEARERGALSWGEVVTDLVLRPIENVLYDGA